MIRRLAYDLTGLPPTVEEVGIQKGRQPESSGGNRKLVDRLLASPHFGERWGGIGWMSRAMANPTATTVSAAMPRSRMRGVIGIM